MQSFEDLWALVSEKISQDISPLAHDTWIKQIQPMELTADEAVLFVRSSFQKDVLESRYLDKIKTVLFDILGFNVNIRFTTETDLTRTIEEKKEVSSNITGMIRPLSAGDELTFDTFVEGKSNTFAYQMCIAVCNTPAIAYNPLFIYGPSGLGKTHLLHAIQHKIRENFPDFKIIFIKGEDFLNEIIDSIQERKMAEVRGKYRHADLFLVDDVQFVGGRSTQDEFFHTFNALYEAKKQIVLVSDRPPKEMQVLEDRLRNRFEWGIMAEISPPDVETRFSIVKKKAAVLGVSIPHDVVEFICDKVKSNIRQLEGVVKNLKAQSLLSGAKIDLKLAEEAVAVVTKDDVPIQITVDKVIAKVGGYYHVSPEDLLSKKRTAEVSAARHVCIYILREVTNMSTINIGKAFGRDHTTILHSLTYVEKQMANEPVFKETVGDLLKDIINK